MNKDRIACVMIPDFSMAVRLRIDPSLRGKPVALAESESDSSEIYAINKEAADSCVMVGMIVARGKSYCPELIVVQKEARREKAALAKIRELLFTASPLVEETEAGCFFIDASGLKWLYDNEEDLARQLVSLIGSLKIPVKVGIANNKFVSHTAARTSPDGSFTVVPAKSERRFLNHLSIDHLPLSEDIHDQLLALGLKTIGQVAAFPSNEITARFGKEGAAVSRLSKGNDADFFLPEFSRVKISSRLPLFEPLKSVQAVVTHVEQALGGLLEKLSDTGRGCSAVDVKLELERCGTPSGGDARKQFCTVCRRLIYQTQGHDKSCPYRAKQAVGQTHLTAPESLPTASGGAPTQVSAAHERNLHLALKQPVATPHKFIRLLFNKLNSLRLPSGVMDITVVIPEVVMLVSSQLELMKTSGSLKASFADDRRVVDELRRVTLLSPSVNDAIIPDDNFSLRPMGNQTSGRTSLSGTRTRRNAKQFCTVCRRLIYQTRGHDKSCPYRTRQDKGQTHPTTPNKTGIACFAVNPVAGLRLLSPPQKASVVSSGKRLRQMKLKLGTQPIVEQNGPWELSGAWWEYGFDRLYYEVQTDDHRLYLLYFDRKDSDWYVQGVFD